MRNNCPKHWVFFIYTFLWSWCFWTIPIIYGIENTVPKFFYALAGIAPSLMEIILAYKNGDKKYWRNFWTRILSFRLISLKWYLVIFLPIVLSNAIAVISGYFLTGKIPEFNTLNYYLSNPLKLLTFILFMFVFGPIAEEIGWRGYALDHLEKEYSWFTCSMIISLFWALWHLPLFFIQGTYQYNLTGESFLYFIVFIIEFFPESVIMTWIYSNNKKSILSGILFHFAINFFGELIDIPNQIKIFRTAVLLFIAIIILISWRKRGLITLRDGV